MGGGHSLACQCCYFFRSLLILTSVLLSISSSCHGFGVAKPRKLYLVQQQPLVLEFHNGQLLKGNYTLNLIWYGSFSFTQRDIVSRFVRSLNPSAGPVVEPSVASWWRTTEKYDGMSTRIKMGRTTLLKTYPLGKFLNDTDILDLAASGRHRHSINVVLTSADVVVERFCMNRCGSHGSAPAGKRGRSRFAYIWVGNSVSQCPGQCAWPFHNPIYGPQSQPLVSPNSDVGIDGMVINLATLLAGTVTNPFDGGYFQGPKEAPLEAVSACPGMFGKGAYPGYPGEVLVDKDSDGSYNAVGSGREYLLPAMWDPKTLQCSTTV